MSVDPSSGSAGPGGPPYSGDDPSAWWEDTTGWNDFDGWEEFPRRRRSRVVMVTGVVVAVALVLGSAGTALDVILGGSSPVALPVSDVSIAQNGTHSTSPQATTGDLRVTFQVYNPTDAPVVPVCEVGMVQGDHVLGPLVGAPRQALAAGAVAFRQVSVPVARSSAASPQPRVACQT